MEAEVAVTFILIGTLRVGKDVEVLEIELIRRETKVHHIRPVKHPKTADQHLPMTMNLLKVLVEVPAVDLMDHQTQGLTQATQELHHAAPRIQDLMQVTQHLDLVAHQTQGTIQVTRHLVLAEAATMVLTQVLLVVVHKAEVEEK